MKEIVIFLFAPSGCCYNSVCLYQAWYKGRGESD